MTPFHNFPGVSFRFTSCPSQWQAKFIHTTYLQKHFLKSFKNKHEHLSHAITINFVFHKQHREQIIKAGEWSHDSSV